MTPSYPVDIPKGAVYVRIKQYMELHELECAMIRIGVRCANTTEHGVLYTLPDSTRALVPICDMCVDDLALTGPDRTDRWRAQQREWGVR